MSNADAAIAALRVGHDRLAKHVGTLTDADLAGPSGASEWDLSQVISHLGSGAEINANTVRAALAGRPNPGSELNKAIWDRWDSSSRRERADGFVRANAALRRPRRTRYSQLVNRRQPQAPWPDAAWPDAGRHRPIGLPSAGASLPIAPARCNPPRGSPLFVSLALLV